MHIENKKRIVVDKTVEEVRNFFLTKDTPLGKLTKDKKKNHFKVNSANEKNVWTITVEEDHGKTFIASSCNCEHEDTLWEKLSSFVDNDKKSVNLSVEIYLRQVKSLIETGEIATVKGQPHGERSLLGEALSSWNDKKKERGDHLIAVPTNTEKRA